MLGTVISFLLIRQTYQRNQFLNLEVSVGYIAYMVQLQEMYYFKCIQNQRRELCFEESVIQYKYIRSQEYILEHHLIPQFMHWFQDTIVHVWVSGHHSSCMGFRTPQFMYGFQDIVVHVWVSEHRSSCMGFRTPQFMYGFQDIVVHVWVS